MCVCVCVCVRERERERQRDRETERQRQRKRDLFEIRGDFKTKIHSKYNTNFIGDCSKATRRN